MQHKLDTILSSPTSLPKGSLEEHVSWPAAWHPAYYSVVLCSVWSLVWQTGTGNFWMFLDRGLGVFSVRGSCNTEVGCHNASPPKAKSPGLLRVQMASPRETQKWAAIGGLEQCLPFKINEPRTVRIWDCDS